MTTTKDLVARARQRIREVAPAEAQSRIDQGAVALDVREPDEVSAGHLQGALHIPRGCLEFQAPVHEALKNAATPVVLYCKGGNRSALAAATLQDLGYTDVVSVEGGYDAWVQAGYPVAVGEPGDEEE